MDTFYITRDEFWDWFNRDPTDDEKYLAEASLTGKLKTRANPMQGITTNEKLNDTYNHLSNKRVKTKDGKTRHILETEAATRSDIRYVILYGRHRPGKKSKVWEGDGYLSLIGQVAHICDLKGKMLEEPTALDEIDLAAVEDLGELMIGNTDVQIVEVDEK